MSRCKSLLTAIIVFISLAISKRTLNAQNNWVLDSLNKLEVLSDSVWENHRNGELKYYYARLRRDLAKKSLAERSDSILYRHFGNAYNQMGNAQFAMGRHEEASFHYDSCIAIFIKAFGVTDYELRIPYTGQAKGALFKGDYEKAIDRWQAFFNVLKSNQKGDGAPQNPRAAVHNLGLIYEEMGKLEKALPYYKEAAEISLDQEHYGVAIADLDRIGYFYLLKGEYELAKEAFSKIHDIITEKFNYTNPRQYAFLRMAALHSAMEEDSLAEEWLLKARPLPPSHKAPYFSIGICMADLGDIYFNRGLFEKALPLYQEVYAICSHKKGAGIPFVKYIAIHLKVTSAFIELNEADSALANVQRLIEELMPGFDMENPPNDLSKYHLGPGILTPFAFSQYGKAISVKYAQTSQLSHLEKALTYHDLAARLIDALRKDFYLAGSKQILISRAIELYEGAVETALKLYEQTNNPQHLGTAFSFAEKSKSVLLLESLQGSKAQSFAGIPQELLDKEKDLKIDIAFYGKRIYDEQNKKNPDTEKISRWEDHTLQMRNGYDSLLTIFQQQYPDYYQLKYDIQYATVEEIRNYLPDEHTACIEYFWGKENLYAFLITKDKVDCIRKPLSEEMDSHLESFTKLLSRPDLGSLETYANHAGYLYDFLLRDVLTDTKVEHLAIIPDGRLGYLPFQVLIDNRQLEGVEDYRKLPYVINNYEVRYEYSSTLLLAEHTPKQQRGGFLGFAPQYGDGGTGISVRAAVEEDILEEEEEGETMRLSSLQYTQTEVEEISHLFTGQSHIGNLATEAAFKSEASKHSILHLAMHAHTSDENPMYSRLIFQQGASEGGEDGMLYAYELYNMNLQAELAVLSACETGTGKLQNGEGIMSLSRAFKYAGCPNIVMSLWQADDASTKDIMVQFYQNLKLGKGKAGALRHAKMEYLKNSEMNKSHPFYWATFVLAGDGKPLEVE